MRRAVRVLGFLAIAAALPACGIGGSGTLAPTVAPQVPQNVTATIGNHSVTLNWTGSAPATSYTVKRSDVPGGPYTALPLGTVTTTTFIDAGLVNHVTRYYVVSASNSFGESPDSPEIAAAGALKAVYVSAGSNSSSALLQDGTVWSWGVNIAGNLGNGLNTDSNVPVQAVGLPPIVQLQVGGSTGVALDGDGRIWSWGSNDKSQLGRTGAVKGEPTPALVDTSGGLPRANAISSGWYHTLVRGVDGTLWSWGFSGEGRLGSPGPDAIAARPVVLPPGLSVATAIATGDAHSMVLSQDGTVWCWGGGTWGQLGDPSIGYVNSVVPVQVRNLTGVVAIAGGAAHSLALRNDGTVWAWGGNYNGQLGNGVGNGTVQNPKPPAPPDAAPVKISATCFLTGVIAIEAQGDLSLALRSDGTVWSWGGNSPALGDPLVPKGNYRSLPAPVVGLTGQVAIAAGGFSFSVGADGSVSAWGGNAMGECAFGTSHKQAIAIQMPQLNSITKIAGGGSPDPFQTDFGSLQIPGEGHGLAISTVGQAWSWGNNNDQQLGQGPLAPIKTGAPGLVQQSGGLPQTNVTAIAGGGTHSVLISRGDIFCSGANADGQLGCNNNLPTNQSVKVLKAGGLNLTNPPGSPQAVGISAGEAHSVAVLDDGTVWTWGRNTAGQLGIGPAGNSNFAVQVQTSPGVYLIGVVAVSAGFDHCVALTGAGDVYAWGDNQWGQVGNGLIGGSVLYATRVQNKTPAGNLTGIVEIAAGRFHTLARTSTGTVVSWGDNSMAQLGADPAITQVWPTRWILGNTTQPNHPYHPLGAPTLIEPAAVPVVDASATPVGNVVGISAGAFHSVALRDDLNNPAQQSIWTWGNGYNGELGNADATLQSPAVPASFPFNSALTPFSPVPVPVQRTAPTGFVTLRGITQISAGANFAMGRGSDGTVWAWGSNAQSQLGADVVSDIYTPVPVDP